MMDDTQLFEELNAPAAAQQVPIGSHHYVADEDVAAETTGDATDDTDE